MGSGDWFKSIFSLRKGKDKSSKQAKASSKSKVCSSIDSPGLSNSTAHTNGISGLRGLPTEDIAATRIQTAFRAHLARKALHRLKGIVRLQVVAQNYSVNKQPISTLNYLHSWNKVQTQIRARRLCMVTEGRIKQRNLENQQKLESKLHDLEVEWDSGSETREEILARIFQREEAALRRERAMAYAFSHQWRANPSQYYWLGKDELGKANWGWSWKDRWIAARPWEIRVSTLNISPKNTSSRQGNKTVKTANLPVPKPSASKQKPVSNGKEIAKPKRLSFQASEKSAAQEINNNSEEGKAQTE